MSQTRGKNSRAKSAPRGRQAAKVAITVRLDAERVRQLQAAAEGENRTITNYVETALIRDLEMRDEASRVITMYVAPGVPDRIEPEEVIRGPGESDAAYAKRQALVVALWSIPDNT